MEDSRNHILKTALQLFLEKSYKAVTFQELMEKTGFSKGAFFHYFNNKQEIFEAAISLYIAQFASVDFAMLPQDSLRGFLDAYFPHVRKKRSQFFDTEFTFAANHYSLIFEALRILPDFKDKINIHEEQALRGWTTIIATARKSKEIKATLSDERMARLFIDAGHGVVLHLLMTDNTAAMEKKVKNVWNNLYQLMKA